MGGFEEFKKLMSKAMAAQVAELMARYPGALQSRLWNELMDLPGPRTVDHTPSARERYLRKLGRGFFEIIAAGLMSPRRLVIDHTVFGFPRATRSSSSWRVVPTASFCGTKPSGFDSIYSKIRPASPCHPMYCMFS